MPYTSSLNYNRNNQGRLPHSTDINIHTTEPWQQKKSPGDLDL